MCIDMCIPHVYGHIYAHVYTHVYAHVYLRVYSHAHASLTPLACRRLWLRVDTDKRVQKCADTPFTFGWHVCRYTAAQACMWGCALTFA